MKINNIRDMELKLCKTLECMTSDKEGINYAREVANLSGKLMKAQCESMRYSELKGETTTLPFMERDNKGEYVMDEEKEVDMPTAETAYAKLQSVDYMREHEQEMED